MFPLHDPPADALRAELKEYDDLTAALLARRGVATKEAAEAFLNPSYDCHLHDPLSMTDMAKAVARLARAIEVGERIAVWSDYDCDGIPAAVVLHDFLKKAGANFSTYIPHRHFEGYGVSVAGVEKLAREGARLVITADVGITDRAAIARAGELGVEVVVTDHHLPEAGEDGEPLLPEAYAVVDPKARADEPYLFKDLCGAGLAWKLVCATLAALRAEHTAWCEDIPEGWEKWLLDMVGLATIADVVPLAGENRVLAAYGLRVLRKSPRTGLKALCRAARLEQRRITEDDVGFMIAPRVNAASRMGEARDAFDLFTTESPERAEALAQKLERANRSRKAQSGAITRAVRERLGARGALGGVIALGDPAWPPALLGLAAAGIAEEYARPVFLWGREGSGALKGSVRSGSVHALALMRATTETFEQFGGHAASGGFTVRADAIFSLEERLEEALRSLGGDARAEALAARADAVIASDESMEEILARIERLAPFGRGNPKPLFRVGANIRAISYFGKGKEHLKLRVETGGAAIDAVAFFAKRALARADLAVGARATFLAHLERDTFSRDRRARLRLVDIRLV